MYELWNTHCVISVILQMREMFLYSHLKVTLPNIKMDEKIRANDLKFKKDFFNLE